MQLFLDSADEAQVRYWLGQGILDGITTNPTVLRRDGVSDPVEAAVKLADLVRPGVVNLEVTEERGTALMEEATALSRLGPNIVVKVPVLTPDGEPLLHEIAELTTAGVIVNCTACLSFGQAALASKAGAQYVSILVGRVDDEGGDGAKVVADARRWLDRWDNPTKLIAASMRGPADAQRSMCAGAHCLALPAAILRKLVDHRYARDTVRQFLNDAQAGKQGRTT